MMLRLLNLTITDFKGVEGTFNISFDSEVVFLNGPNGYGKTTIYDAIELCMTGMIGRIEERRSSENANKRHQGSVLHNKPSKDIIIILELKKDEATRAVKVTYPKPTAAHQLVDWSNLVTELLDEEGSVIGARKEVGELLGIDGDNYRLFTYLQQADNTYFLKRAQKDRHNLLSPLLDSSGKYSDELSDIDKYKKKLNSYKSHLDTQLKSFDIDDVSKTDDVVAYEKLIDGDEVYEYDTKEPFDGYEIEAAKTQYKKIVAELNRVSELLDEFNPDEYIKSEKLNFLNARSDDKSFCRYIASRNIISNQSLIDDAARYLKVNAYVQDADKVKKYVLRRVLDKDSYEKTKLIADQYAKNNRALYDGNGELQPVHKIMTYISLEQNGFSENDRATAKKFLEEYSPLANATDAYGKVIAELQRSRRDLMTQFEAALTHKHQDSSKCPLCGSSWADSTQLLESINKETEVIQGLLTSQSKQLATLEDKIKSEYLDQLKTLNEGLKTEATRFEAYRSIGVLNENDIEANLLIDKAFPLLQNTSGVTSGGSEAETANSTRLLKEYVSKELSENAVKVADSIVSLSTKDYSKYIDAVQRLDIKIDDVHLLPGTSLPSPEEFIKAQNGIIEIFESTAKLIVIKPEQATPEHASLYKELFGSNKQKFQNAKNSIKNKYKYIDQKFGNTYLHKKKLIELRHEKIKGLIGKVADLQTDYRNALKEYQHNITKNIQLPFYIYSAKILQNSPQCQGVFMFVQKDTGTVVFTPERGATHDVIHQLSSGQLVVVSMAFYLAINAVFSEQSTGLMAIDDPIQDLDSLNVHSLVELMRREFVGKYQLIMSAHSELDVNYMKYKFGVAYEGKPIIDINVQETFFKAQLG